MIISASRRTDIPAFYSPWLLNRLRAGYVLTRNPMNHSQISRIPLSPDLVDCIVFWTKDPSNMLNLLPNIDALGYKYYFQFTLTPYQKPLERNLRDKEQIETVFIELSKRLGKERVLWRYDPIILNEAISVDYHKEQFARLCDTLGPYSESVTISFVDLYPKLKTHLIRKIEPEEIAEVSEYIGRTAQTHGLTVKACSEEDLSQYGIVRGRCIDKAVIEKVCGYPLMIKRDKNQRQGCGCYESVDIGAYNTCLHDCVYCYANRSITSAGRNFRAHDPQGELLLGTADKGAVIRIRNVQSHRASQLSLF